MSVLESMAYFGGKAGGVGTWIAGLLPYRHVYVEPFAGMGKVLLKRPPSRIEILNDRDDDLMTWWRIVRDPGTNLQLCELIARTPHARSEFYRARRDLPDRDRDPVLRALDVTIILQQAFQHSLRTHRTGWRRSFSTRIQPPTLIAARIEALCDRLRDVQLECTPAAELLTRTRTVADAVIYCDPPYWKAARYRHQLDLDERAELVPLLQAQAGIVAVSGYGDEWDDLGWRRLEHATITSMVKRRDMKRRTEVLWINT